MTLLTNLMKTGRFLRNRRIYIDKRLKRHLEQKILFLPTDLYDKPHIIIYIYIYIAGIPLLLKNGDFRITKNFRNIILTLVAAKVYYEKENSEFKHVKLRLKIDLVSYSAQAEGLLNKIMFCYSIKSNLKSRKLSRKIRTIFGETNSQPYRFWLSVESLKD